MPEFLLKTKCFYLIKYDQVYGTLTVFSDHLLFQTDPDAT